MRAALLTTLLAATACGLPFDIEDGSLPMTVTDAPLYRLSVDSVSGQVTLEVPYTLTNASSEVLTMVHCGKEEPEFERLVDGRWELVPGGPELGCLSLTHIQPGGLHQSVARMWWDSVGDAPEQDLTGTYRLHWYRLWAEYRDYDTETRTWGTRLPARVLVSNTFEVIEQ